MMKTMTMVVTLLVLTLGPAAARQAGHLLPLHVGIRSGHILGSMGPVPADDAFGTLGIDEFGGARMSGFFAVYAETPSVRVGMEFSLATSKGRHEILASAKTVAHLGVEGSRRMRGSDAAFVDVTYALSF